MKYLVTDRNDEIQGPYSLEEIRNLLASGGIDAAALSCEEGSEKWQPLVSILPPVKSGSAPVKSPRRPETPVPKPEVNTALVICIFVFVALLSLTAYFIGRRL